MKRREKFFPEILFVNANNISHKRTTIIRQFILNRLILFIYLKKQIDFAGKFSILHKSILKKVIRIFFGYISWRLLRNRLFFGQIPTPEYGGCSQIRGRELFRSIVMTYVGYSRFPCNVH